MSQLGRYLRSLLLAMAFAVALLPAHAATLTWTGAASAQWSNPANWDTATIPANGDSLVFPSGAASLANTNDLVGLSIVSVTIDGDGYTLGGNGIVLTSSLTASVAVSANTLSLPLDVQANTVAVSSAGLGALRITGGLAGTGTINLSGTNIIAGSATFSGTVSGGNAAVLRLEGASMASSTMNGVLLIGHGAAGAMTAGSISPGSSAAAATGVGNGTGIVSTGNLSGVTMSFDLDGAAPGTGYDQVVVTGTVDLTGASLNLQLSSLYVPASNIDFKLIDNDGTDAVVGTFSGRPEGFFTFMGPGNDPYILTYKGGDGNDVVLIRAKRWTGAVNTLWSEPGNWADNTVPMSGNTLLFEENGANKANTNDMTGLVVPFIMFSQTGGFVLGGNTIVVTNAILIDVGFHTINMPVDVQGNSVVFARGFSNTQLTLGGTLSGTGPIRTEHNVVINGGTHTYSGTITLACGGGCSGLHLLNEASLPSATVTSASGAALTGRGSVGSFTGFVAPGTSTSATSNNGLGRISASSASITQYALRVNGTTPGLDYDQLRVTGNVTLTGATLQFSVGPFTPYPGQQYVIIDNQGTGPTVGTFNGAPQGTMFTLNGYQYFISYVGGDGNDVVLTALTGLAPTTMTLTSSPKPSGLGESVTLTATVSGLSGSPTGTVTFYDGLTSLGTASLASGVATLATSALSQGLHSLTASYPGDGSFGSNSATTSHEVRLASATSVVSSLNPAEIGAPVTFTATVTGTSPTGSVTFKDGATTLGVVALSGGTAAHITSSLAMGAHPITAEYGGDSSNAPSAGTLAGGQSIVDTIAPDTGINSYPAAVTGSTSASFAFVGSDPGGAGVASFECRLDGGAFSPCISPRPYVGLAPGSHTFEARAIDVAGNPDATPASYTWIIDTTPPTVTLAGPFAVNSVNQGAFVITGTCSESTFVTVSIQGQGITAMPACIGGGFSTSGLNLVALADGGYTVNASQADAAGNLGTASAALQKETSTPSVTIAAPATITLANQAAYAVSGTCSENGRAVTVQVDSIAAAGTCGALVAGQYTTSAVDVSALAQGPVSLTASHTSAVGNTGTATAGTSKDTIGPALTIDAMDTVGNANKAAYGIGGTCEAAGGTVGYLLSSGASVNGTVPCKGGAFTAAGLDLTGLDDGTVSVSVTQADARGNAATTNGTVRKDTVNPSVSIDVPATINAANQAAYTLTGTCSESGRAVTLAAGPMTGTVACGTPAGGFAWTVDLTSLPNGPVAFFASLTDSAANVAIATATGSKDATVAPPNPPRLGNISTRMQVLTGNDVMIGGFVISGSTSKTVAIVATGPSLVAFGITNPLSNPTLTLVRSSDQSVVASNNDWQSAANQAELSAAGFAPSNPLEAAILVDLAPGAYTAIVQGSGGGTGISVIGVYEVDHPETPLVNISTRGRVLTGNDVMIGGFVVTGSGPQTLAIVATGPSLASFGIASPLANPTLTLVRSSDQAVLATNDDWQTHANASQLSAAGFAPSSPLEAAIYTTLPPGAYTAIVRGAGESTGVAVIGVYKVN